METRVPLQPRPHLQMLVRRVVVQNQMQIQLDRRLPLQESEKLDELLVPMPRQAGADQVAFGHIQRCKQRDKLH